MSDSPGRPERHHRGEDGYRDARAYRSASDHRDYRDDVGYRSQPSHHADYRSASDHRDYRDDVGYRSQPSHHVDYRSASDHRDYRDDVGYRSQPSHYADYDRHRGYPDPRERSGHGTSDGYHGSDKFSGHGVIPAHGNFGYREAGYRGSFPADDGYRNPEPGPGMDFRTGIHGDYREYRGGCGHSTGYDHRADGIGYPGRVNPQDL